MQYSIVVAGNKGFVLGLTAFLNSFELYHNTSLFQVFILDYDLPEDWKIKQIEERPYLKIMGLDKEKYRDHVWACKIERFNFAASLPGIVGLFDADMYFCASIMPLFKIAEIGLIVAGANGSNFRFHQGWRDKYKIPEIPDMFNYKTITSVPTIMDVDQHGEVWKSIYKHKMSIGIGADFDLTNIFMVVHNKLDYLFVIPSQQVTGIHHFMLKPDTRVRLIDNKLVTTDGLEVLIVHGKWWQPNYREGIMKPIERSYQPKQVKMALESRDILIQEFERYLHLGD